MKTTLLLLLLLLLAAVSVRALFFSFRAQAPGDYAATGPAFDIRQALSGPMIAEGVIYGPKGRMTNSFTGRMEGRWTGDQGILTEVFTYSNGNVTRREWTLAVGADGHFTGTAPDVVGQATGWMSGATAMMRYRLRLPDAAGGHVLSVSDWLYLTDTGTVVNRSEMRKFGIKVAELVATMRPAGTGQ